MSGDDVWVGFDVGTQGARALAVCGDGRVLGRDEVALRGRREGARHEQDPLAWWESIAAASHGALRGVAPGRVRGVATCATSGTILLVDADGEPLTPGLMYDDARAVAQAARAAMPASWALPKLLWMLEDRPELACGARVAHQADVITRRLVGHEVPADSSHALKTGYDVEHERWPDLGLPDALLPEVVRPGTVLGEVCTSAAALTGLPQGTPVVAGMTDGCAAQLAAGAVREGCWSSVLGTTLALKGCSARPLRDDAGVLYNHRSPDGSWLPGGASSTGAGVLTSTFPGRDLDELGELAVSHEATKVLAYPLVSRGERFPFAAAEAEAFMIGEPSGDGERFAALLQGVALVERLCFDYVDLLGGPAVRELTLTGGATRSRRWSQLRADVLGHPVRLVEQPDAAFGMAVLAAAASPAAAAGGAGIAQAVSAMVRARELIEPRAGDAAHLTGQYLRLVEELRWRGWLGAALAEHARLRAAQGSAAS
ncbi:MAG: FGGY-family carbohydrate kinase [Solirubrobacteraceae bacterium]